MSETMEGVAVQPLAKGQKVGQSLTLYGGRVMPQTFGQVVEFAQMMCKAEGAIAPPLVNNPGACMAIIQRSLAWEVDPWAVATKVYLVNGILAYEAQLVASIVKKWAPIKERAIPYVFEGEGLNMTCSITVHHAETGEAFNYKSPKVSEIEPRKSPLWKVDTRQQLGYYSIRALARRHFPEIILGVYDREEAMSQSMKDITPDKPVENYLNDDEGRDPQTGEVIPPKPNATIFAAPSPNRDDPPGTVVWVDSETNKIVSQPNVVDETDVVGVESEYDTLLHTIEAHTDAVVLQNWQNENHARINRLPMDQLKTVRKALADRLFDLEKT